MVVEVKEKLDNELIIEAPAWRTDIHIAEDVIEEVGRLLGLDNISLDLPKKSFSGSEVAPMWQLKQELRRILSDRLGMHEILTYSFVSKDLLEKAGQDPENSYEITNSISPELQRFRQQIAPSVLSKVRENIKAGYNNFSLYELNQVTNRRGGLTDEGTPVMKTHLGAVELGDFYQLKAKILAMFRELHLPVEYQGLTSEAAKIYPYLEPKRSAEILVNGQRVGAFGELKLGVLKRFKLEQVVTALELELDGVIEVPRQLQVELKISKFPFVERDLTLKVASDAIFGRFDGCLRDILTQQKLIYTVSPMSIYQANSNDATKNISFHLRFSSAEKTLNQSEISDIMNNITMEVTKLGAEVI